MILHLGGDSPVPSVVVVGVVVVPGEGFFLLIAFSTLDYLVLRLSHKLGLNLVL